MNLLYNVYFKIFLRKLSKEKITKEQWDDIVEVNVRKHTKIFALSLLTLIYTYCMVSFFYVSQIDTVITSLLGVLFVSGGAWFAISFGTVPERLIDFAMEITSFLFASFSVSLAAVFAVTIVAVPLLSPVLFIAFFSVYTASAQYDFVDAMKIGIDEAVFEHAKVGKRYFVRELEKTGKKK